MKRLLSALLLLAGMLVSTEVALAHDIVKPAQVGIGAEQTFVLGVPNERQTAVIAVRLVIPDGVQDVVPTVKPGWVITTTKSKGDDPQVTEIRWTAGRIPVGERDEFGFSAQVPATPTTLAWKAYQTYADGTVVSWDQAPVPNAPDDDSAIVGPYSQTQVVDDLSAAAPATDAATTSSLPPIDQVALSLSAVALAISIISWRKRSKPSVDGSVNG